MSPTIYLNISLAFFVWGMSLGFEDAKQCSQSLLLKNMQSGKDK